MSGQLIYSESDSDPDLPSETIIDAESSGDTNGTDNSQEQE